MSELKSFVAIGPYCWGQADNIYEAIKNAEQNRVTSYGPPRFLVYLVSEDWKVNNVTGAISAEVLHPLGWFGKGAQALKGKPTAKDLAKDSA